MRNRLHWYAAVLSSFVGTFAVAQVPPDIAAQNRTLGERIDVPSAIRTYSALEEQPPYQEPVLRITRDLAYGDDPRHRLDVFAPVDAPKHRRPVVIFATGGDFTRRINLPGGAPFYDNVVLWAARHGLVGVNTDRRHFRGRTWETGPEDMAAMIGWVHRHIAEYGGDPERVIFLGHAYGGTQLVSYLAHPEYWCCRGPGIAGAVVISAPLNLAPEITPQPPVAPPSAAVQGGAVAGIEPANSGPNPLFDPAHSDLAGLANIKVPVFLGATQFDGRQQRLSLQVFRERLCSLGRCPDVRTFADHNHLSVMFSFNTSDGSVSDAVLDWMRTRVKK